MCRETKEQSDQNNLINILAMIFLDGYFNNTEKIPVFIILSLVTSIAPKTNHLFVLSNLYRSQQTACNFNMKQTDLISVIKYKLDATSVPFFQ